MRAYYAMLFLTPLTLCASIPRSPVASSNRPTVPPSDRPAVASSNRPTVAPSDRPADTWTPPTFKRYTVILTRMPFGQAPAVVAPPVSAASAAPPPPPPALAKLTLCAINRTPAGSIEVGFVDGSANPPHSYLLNVGETEGGFTAVCANIDQETATIGKDGVNIDLHMGKGPAVGSPISSAINSPISSAITQHPNPTPPNTPPTRIAATPPMPTLPTPSPANLPVPSNLKAIDTVLKMGITDDSYLARLKKRREEVLAQQATVDPTVDEKTTALFEKILRARNLYSIRNGEPGLGIPLTADEDAQLVSEGVLPVQK